MSHCRNIIIVGTDNTTRTYMAEAVFARLCEENNLEDVSISSRGLVVLFPEPVNPKAAKVVENAGYQVGDFEVAQLTAEEVEAADLIFTITQEEKERVLADFSGEIGGADKVFTLSEAAKEPVGIPNPYGKELEDYATCFIVIKRMSEKCFDNRILMR